MANRILTGDNWQQRIRDIMGVDVAYLTNSAIEQPDIITIAEANIIEQVPDYASLQDDKKIYLEAAVVCECASLLCPGMVVRLPTKEQGPSETHEINVDWNKKKIEFETERNAYVGKITADSATPDLLHFRITNPRRCC